MYIGTFPLLLSLNTILIFLTYQLLSLINKTRNDWEKAYDLNLTTYQGGEEMKYNITDVIINNQPLCESLEKLKKTLFFKIFKINLDPECSVLKQEMICRDTACQICECQNGEVPGIWTQPTNLHESVVTSIDDPFNKWREKYNFDSKQWLVKEDIDPEEGSYVNLLKNPEGYTGYKGAHIWIAIFRENCFADRFNTLCKEDRIFYRIFSGWLSNTNFQIGCNYHGKNKNETFLNVSMVTNKILYNKEKLDYLFFLYSLMLKSVSKAAPLLVEYNYTSGNKTEDHITTSLIKDIFRYHLKNIDNLEDSFEETYKDFENFMHSTRISELIVRFRNISSLIDCVTCSKCRMHAKLEVIGMATMLKIMFTPSLEELKTSINRNELVSFINLFAKLSKSVSNVKFVNDGIINAHQGLKYKKAGGVALMTVIGIILNMFTVIKNSDKKNNNIEKKDEKNGSKEKQKRKHKE